jgi:hypothetical protein
MNILPICNYNLIDIVIPSTSSSTVQYGTESIKSKTSQVHLDHIPRSQWRILRHFLPQCLYRRPSPSTTHCHFRDENSQMTDRLGLICQAGGSRPRFRPGDSQSTCKDRDPPSRLQFPSMPRLPTDLSGRSRVCNFHRLGFVHV